MLLDRRGRNGSEGPNHLVLGARKQGLVFYISCINWSVEYRDEGRSCLSAGYILFNNLCAVIDGVAYCVKERSIRLHSVSVITVEFVGFRVVCVPKLALGNVGI